MDPYKPFIPETAIDGPEIDRSDEEIAWLNDYERSTDPPDADGLAFLEELYDANIRYMDRELARLLRELRERPWYDDALIVFVGDHGELFGEHGRMFHPWDMDPPDLLIRTPLLVKYPGGAHAGETFDHLVQHGDIPPTVAQATGTETPGLPTGIQPLINTGERHILSKANTAIRLTESNVTAVRRRDGTDDGLERVSATGREILEAAIRSRLILT